MSDKWVRRFLELASTVAQWSKDPNTKVGAVIVDDKNRVVSLGFNGFPRRVSDDKELYQDRTIKLRSVVHAEINAILFAKQDLTGCTLYVTPLAPCAQCASAIIQSGISRVVTLPTKVDSKWVEEIAVAKSNLNAAGVRFDIVDFHSR